MSTVGPANLVESRSFDPASGGDQEATRDTRPDVVADDAPSWLTDLLIDPNVTDAPLAEDLLDLFPAPPRHVFDDLPSRRRIVADEDPVEEPEPERGELEPAIEAVADVVGDVQDIPPKQGERTAEAVGSKGRRDPSSTVGPAAASQRSIERGPRRRKPPRERGAGGRRGESPGRMRPESGDNERPGDRPAGDRPDARVEWPSVREILANHQGRTGPRPAVERRSAARQAIPTIPRPPDQWSVSGWIALPPVGMVVMALGLLACGLAWRWVSDSSNAAVATDRLLAAGRRGPPPSATRGRWPTARTLDRHDGPASGPLGRLHRPRHPGGTRLPGGSTDPAAARPRGLAVESDGSPVALAARGGSSDPARTDAGGGPEPRCRKPGMERPPPGRGREERGRFAALPAGPRGRRVRKCLASPTCPGLPRRTSAGQGGGSTVYAAHRGCASHRSWFDLVARDGWTAADWSLALPTDPIVLLTAARVLRDRGEGGSEPLLDRILGDEWPGDDRAASPRLLAARAEALVLRSHLREAAEAYRQAIDRVDNDLVRRSWWFNLAEIARRLDDEPQRQAAIRAAVDVAHTDEIATPRPARFQGANGDCRHEAAQAAGLGEGKLTDGETRPASRGPRPLRKGHGPGYSGFLPSPSEGTPDMAALTQQAPAPRPGIPPSAPAWKLVTMLRRSLAEPADRPSGVGRWCACSSSPGCSSTSFGTFITPGRPTKTTAMDSSSPSSPCISPNRRQDEARSRRAADSGSAARC